MLESLANLAKDTIVSKNPFPTLEGFAENGSACSWGFQELYPESEKALREALEAKKTFDTRWVGSKHEIISFRIISNGEIVTIQTCAEMDEIDDLINDACGNGVELTAEQHDEVLNMWYNDTEMQTSVWNERTIELTSYDDVIKNLTEMSAEDTKQLDAWFEIVKQWVKDVAESLY